MRHSTLSHEYRVIKNLISQILWWQQTQHFQQKKINFPHLHSVSRAVVCMCCAFVQRHLGVLGSVYTENTLFIHHSNICPSKWISKLFCICSRKMLDVMTNDDVPYARSWSLNISHFYSCFIRMQNNIRLNEYSKAFTCNCNCNWANKRRWMISYGKCLRLCFYGWVVSMNDNRLWSCQCQFAKWDNHVLCVFCLSNSISHRVRFIACIFIWYWHYFAASIISMDRSCCGRHIGLLLPAEFPWNGGYTGHHHRTRIVP